MKHLKALNVFNVSARTCSFTKAADELCITHSAVSKQIQLLEESLNLKLFDRSSRMLALTQDGLLLQNYTRRAFEILHDGINHLQREKKKLILEVSCEPTLTMRWLMPRISSFNEIYPNIDIRLGTSGGPIKLEEKNIDIAIRRDDFNHQPEYNYIELTPEYIGPVTSKKFMDTLNFHNENITLLHSETRINAWNDWINKTKNNIKTSKESYYQHFYFCIQAATDGLGVAIGSHPLIIDDLRANRLIAPYGFINSGFNYVAMVRKNEDSIHIKTFIDWLKIELHKSIPTEYISSL